MCFILFLLRDSTRKEQLTIRAPGPKNIYVDDCNLLVISHVLCLSLLPPHILMTQQDTRTFLIYFSTSGPPPSANLLVTSSHQPLRRETEQLSEICKDDIHKLIFLD